MMKLRSDITINGRLHKKGDEIAWYKIYPFFIVHMLAFGGSGFVIAYGEAPENILFLYLHGGMAILVYTIFYLFIFGRDEVKWMFINAGMGLLGIYTQMGWLLALFGREISDYPLQVHVIPFFYFVLYTFLLHQAVLDITHSRENMTKRRKVESSYIVILSVIYLVSYFATQ